MRHPIVPFPRWPLWVGFFIGIFLISDNLAVAQSSEITLYVGGFVGDSFISKPPALFQPVDTVFNDDVTGGFRYAYFFNRNFAVEGGVGFTPSSILKEASYYDGRTVASAVVGVDTYVFQANMTAHLLKGPVIPYVTAGIGAVHFDFALDEDYATPSETDFAWNAGAGVKIPIRPNTAIRADGRVFWMNPEFALEETARFIEITGGISILFDF